MNRIQMITNYDMIRVGKRYEDGVFFVISFVRRNLGFDIFKGSEYFGHHSFANAWEELQGCYDAGYRTVDKQ